MPRLPPFSHWLTFSRDSDYDDFHTPPFLVEPLLPFIPADWMPVA